MSLSCHYTSLLCHQTVSLANTSCHYRTNGLQRVEKNKKKYSSGIRNGFNAVDATKDIYLSPGRAQKPPIGRLCPLLLYIQIQRYDRFQHRKYHESFQAFSCAEPASRTAQHSQLALWDVWAPNRRILFNKILSDADLKFTIFALRRSKRGPSRL